MDDGRARACVDVGAEDDLTRLVHAERRPIAGDDGLRAAHLTAPQRTTRSGGGEACWQAVSDLDARGGRRSRVATFET